MPQTFPFWLLIALFVIWLCAQLIHREAMQYVQAGRIVFEDPFVDCNIALRGTDETGARRVIGHNDIAKIVVRNRPYDIARGNAIENCYASIEFFEQESVRAVLRFDYPRWQDNPKPGYQGNPGDHVRDEWNRRTLYPTGEPSTLNFLVKSIDDDCAFGFRARSQLNLLWHDPRLRLEPGNYIAKLVLSGVGLTRPAEKWLQVKVGGRDQSIEIDSTHPVDTRRWF